MFDSLEAPADEALLGLIEESLAGADLAAPPVVLPDFYHKSGNMEMPSSMAVATRSSVRPALTSASLNCGMALLALDSEPPPLAAIEEFFRQVRKRYPYPPGLRRELRHADVLRTTVEGAHFAVDRFGIDASELHRIEEGGRLELETYGGAERVRRELPWLVVELSRMRFGTVGPSTHFVELQEVAEILDPAAARSLGLQAGQAALQYHGGDGILNIQVGSLFGRRKVGSRRLKTTMAFVKPVYHLASARSLAQLRLRLSLYFAGGCPPVPRDGPEGERLMLANAVAMNYGFAYRMATYATLDALARRVLGTSSRLIVDSPHNSIYEEEVNGERAIVHRHNSCRAYPASRMVGHPVFGAIGAPLLLPGTSRTSSYLCAASEGAALSLYSACHGSGSIIDDFVTRGLSAPSPHRRSTLRFNYSDAAPMTVPHLDDRGVNEALRILVAKDIVRPVARLRPLAVLT